MTRLAEPSWLAALALVLLGAGLLAVTRVSWMRIGDEAEPRTTHDSLVRIFAVALCSSVAAVAFDLAPGFVPYDLASVQLWAWFIQPEVVTTFAMICLLAFFDVDVNRLSVLLGAGLAAFGGWAGTAWLSSKGAELALGSDATPLLASIVFALMASPSLTAQLVSRVRKSATEAAGDHVVLVDHEGHFAHLSDAARKTLEMPPRPANPRRTPEPLPTTLAQLLSGERPDRSRLRTPSGTVLEARVVDAGPRARWSKTRAILLRDITVEHRDERRLVRLAHRDSLTGIANRRLFLDSLKRMLAGADPNASQIALFYLDLDGFKAINDSLGHAAGDELLKALAERLRTHLRGDEISRFGLPIDIRLVVARLAGDEFAVIAPEIPDREVASALAQHMIEFLGRPLELAGRTIAPSASVGVALFPDHGDDVETLLRHADAALYVAKSRGRMRFAWYESAFDMKADRARRIEESLRGALDRGEMRLHYQPKVDTRTGELVGFEALLRWKSAELGDVGPGEFIPVAEERGLVTKLGSWCLDEACRQLRAWADAGLSLVPVAVNVSSAQFAESDLQREVGSALQRHDILPAYLELELTESLLLDERSNVEQILRDLRSIGVHIALDDFGTGYSALTYLNRFSLDVLKMDRDLLRDIDNDPAALGIARAVVAMAHSLGLRVVAEGVDMEQQLPILRDMRCDMIQGFLFAPALPPEEVVAFMSAAGDPAVRFGPGMVVPGCRKPEQAPAPAEAGAAENAPEADLPDDRPATTADDVQDANRSAVSRPRGRVLLVDDGMGTIGDVAMRLGHLGIDTQYAATADEALLHAGEKGDSIRLVAIPPTVEPQRARSVLDMLESQTGEAKRFVVIGERPDDELRLDLRGAGVDWVLWAPFNDAELRYVVKSAMASRQELMDRREVRVPVDLVANVWAGEKREVAVVSSLSPRGAFIELDDPPPVGTSMRVEMDVGGDRFRGFARVVHTHAEDQGTREPSGAGVVFYGTSRDEDRLLRKAISELESRFQP